MCGPGMPVGCKRAGKRLSVWRRWRVWRVLRVWTVLGRPNGRLGRPYKKPLMCGPGVPVGCRGKSGHKKRLMCGAGWPLATGSSLEILGLANGRSY